MKKILFLLIIVTVSCTGMIDSFVNKDVGHGYKYSEVAGYPMIFRDLPTYKVIPAVVLSYDFNDDFIVALQVDDYIKRDKTSFDVEKIINNIKRNGTYNFWVVSHQTDSIYGPLRLNEYIRLKKELDIPSNLRVEIDL